MDFEDFAPKSKNTYGACYWLASSGVGGDPTLAYFGSGAVFTQAGATVATNNYSLFTSGGENRYNCFAVRPVVSLKSDISADSLQKIEPIEEEENWNYTPNPEA